MATEANSFPDIPIVLLKSATLTPMDSQEFSGRDTRTIEYLKRRKLMGLGSGGLRLQSRRKLTVFAGIDPSSDVGATTRQGRQ